MHSTVEGGSPVGLTQFRPTSLDLQTIDVDHGIATDYYDMSMV